MIADPCGVCYKAVGENHRAICCDICEKWIHIKCNNLNNSDYKFFQENSDEQSICVNCIAENIPFSKLNNNEFTISVKKGVINSSDKEINFVPSDFQQKVFDKLNSAMNNNAFDLGTEIEDDDDEVIPTIDCQYYNVDDFSSAKFNPAKTFSILHYNIHSIERHIEEFRVILKMIDFNFDIICISESKVLKDCNPKVDISIDGYQTPISTPTESTKGGVLIYVKSGINLKPQNDLNVYKSKELESLFIEVINKKESNDIIGVIYRHPCMNGTDFIDEYLKGIVDKLSNENKKVFIADDFNFDLLNVASHNESSSPSYHFANKG